MGRSTFGVIVGNRGFFPDHLCAAGRAAMLEVLEKNDIDVVILPEDATKFGAVETLADARICADLFRKHRDDLDGILVTLPNFGDEKAVANTLKFSDLDIPVLVHAFADDAAAMTIKDRRDSFCGKMSVCNNLRQYGIAFSLTQQHTMDPGDPRFSDDLNRFAAACRVVKGLRNCRLGAIGARPTAFNTVRYSEKLFEATGISVETLDLSELLGWANKMLDSNEDVEEKVAALRAYTPTDGIPEASLIKMAKLGVGIDRWMADNELDATAIQCWTALQEFYGVVPCALMSMMSNNCYSSACETDIAGVVGMHALALASGSPSALLDWNNNYGDDPDKGVVFHCSNLPKAFFREDKMDFQEIIAGSVGKDNTYGTIVGRVKAAPFTYCRVSTDDLGGEVSAYLGQGRFTDDELTTFGGYGVVEIPRFQDLLAFICDYGFEHHVAANMSETAEAVEEALARYLGWSVYHHEED